MTKPTSPALILASASTIRAEMLRNAGVAFKAIQARTDEDSVKAAMLNEGAKSRDIADALAELKARRVSMMHPIARVIGADQVLEFQGEILSKPTSMTEARQHLVALRGQKHSLISAAVIYHNNRPEWRHVAKTDLWMRDFSDAYLDHYLTRLGEEALSCVGSYKLEAEGVRLFSRIEGDYFCVLGMPLVQILGHLTNIGQLEK
ncbi:MAG: septum formation protein Maf [Alphaproteobacteria bacterium]|nr:septum formation protein Maf [Alphaproteobacteria bacterium]